MDNEMLYKALEAMRSDDDAIKALIVVVDYIHDHHPGVSIKEWVLDELRRL